MDDRKKWSRLEFCGRRLSGGFNPKNPKSLALRTHVRPQDGALPSRILTINVGRTCIEAMAAALGHTQSLHTNALDEALAPAN